MRALLLLGSLLVSLGSALPVRNQEGCTGMALGALITALVSGHDQPRRPRQRKETARAYGYEGMACISGERDLEKGGGRRSPDLLRKSLHLWAVRRSWGLA